MIEVYAVLGERPRGAPRAGASGEKLRFVKVGDLVVAAGALDAPPPLDRDGLVARDGLIRELAAASEAILPARWGSLLASEEALRAAIAPRARALAEALEAVRGCEQMTVRFALGEAGRPEAKRAKSGAEYLERRAAARRAPELSRLKKRLGAMVRAERVERRATLVSVHHLVPRGRDEEYRKIVDATPLEVSVRVSGPQPPYAFAPEVGA